MSQTVNPLTDRQIIDEILEAIDLGMNLEGYFAARSLGISHQDLQEGYTAGLMLMEYSAAFTAGVSHQEILDIAALSLKITTYVDLRQAGGVHADIVEAHHLDIIAYSYYSAINQGIPHQDCISCHKAGIAIDALIAAFAENIAIPELLEYKDDPTLFITARRQGLTHQELMVADKEDINFFVMADAKRTFGGLDEFMQAVRAGVHPYNYNRQRHEGQTHQAIMAGPPESSYWPTDQSTTHR
jgi:hypothetical protein